MNVNSIHPAQGESGGHGRETEANQGSAPLADNGGAKPRSWRQGARFAVNVRAFTTEVDPPSHEELKPGAGTREVVYGLPGELLERGVDGPSKSSRGVDHRQRTGEAAVPFSPHIPRQTPNPPTPAARRREAGILRRASRIAPEPRLATPPARLVCCRLRSGQAPTRISQCPRDDGRSGEDGEDPDSGAAKPAAAISRPLRTRPPTLRP